MILACRNHGTALEPIVCAALFPIAANLLDSKSGCQPGSASAVASVKLSWRQECYEP